MRINLLVVEEGGDGALSADLAQRGYNVHSVGDGRRALARVRLDSPAVVLTDICLADMSGAELCLLLRHDASDTRVVMLSGGEPDQQDLEFARQCGASAVLPRSAEADRIVAGIEACQNEPPPLPTYTLDELATDANYMEWQVRHLRGSLKALLNQHQELRAIFKESAEQLRQSQRMDAIGRLAGGITHDFNNVLTAINGYTELLLSASDTPPEHLEYVREIRSAGERAASLTRQLLLFSRPQGLDPHVLDLNAIVSGMDKMLRRLIGEDITFDTRFATDLYPIKADSTQIEQVVLNLAVNARDAMPRGGKLHVETANVDVDADMAARHPGLKPGSYAVLLMSDNGCGMDAATQSRIFEPYFSTKEKGKGTGLGLSTVYGIMKQCGGYVAVESAPGQGATFRIFLLRTEESVPQPAVAPRPAAKLMHGVETILLVEDEKMVRDLARASLERTGYNVLEAENGAEALRMSRQFDGPIHLMITDTVMPGMSGIALAEQMTRERPGIRLLFTSGYTDDIVMRQGAASEEAQFLQKPFGPAELTRVIRSIFSVEDPAVSR